MTINSLFNGIIRVPGASFGEDDAVDTGNARDGLVNNAIHTADMSGQVRVSTLLDGTSFMMGVPDVYQVQRVIPFGPFPLSVRSDGSSYRLRIRVLGHSNAGSSVTFRAVLSPFQSGTPFAEAAVNVSEVATTSTTEAWRDFPSTIYLSPAQVAAATQGMRYPTTIASTTSFTTSYACLVCVSVYLSQSVSSEARIGGFYAAEYIA